MVTVNTPFFSMQPWGTFPSSVFSALPVSCTQNIAEVTDPLRGSNAALSSASPSFIGIRRFAEDHHLELDLRSPTFSVESGAKAIAYFQAAYGSDASAKVLFGSAFPRQILHWSYQRYHEMMQAMQGDYENLKSDKRVIVSVIGKLATSLQLFQDQMDEFWWTWNHMGEDNEIFRVQVGKGIHDADRRPAALNRQLQDLQRLRAGEVELSSLIENFQYDQILVEVAGIMEEGCDLAKTELAVNRVHFDDSQMKFLHDYSPLFVRKDVDILIRMTDIIANLVSNGGRYAKEKDARVKLHANILPGGALEITVADNGIGIAAESIDRMGEHGFREGRKEVAGSHGFGVASVIESLRELSFGPLWIRSSLGVRSEFRFVIPAEAIEWNPKEGLSIPAADGTSYFERYAQEGFIIPKAARTE
ncbi:MAG: hypothetical protein HY540_07555 [Deltaproteobacteria bacterium]|nr:hypothetical protein [Deltaproteobacteria bacterium]